MAKRIIAYTDYKTVDGDRFDTISNRFYGTAKQASDLMAFNIDYVNYLIFPEGINLRIPEFEEDQTLDSLPPWR